MNHITSFSDVRVALEAFYPEIIDRDRPYSLQGVRAILHYVGNPQESVQVVHIAGTSGKTSTAYYAAALLQAAGHTVGLTVSPHVVEINDRVQINGKPLAEPIFCAEMELFLKLIAESKIELTYFELMVAFAFWEFARQKVEYTVVEVGLGGLLDATNTVSNPGKICVITDIGFDHTSILGNTLAKIATQKAGIIHAHNEVFCYRQSDEVMDVIQAQCVRTNATLHMVEPAAPDLGSGLPIFQQRNFLLAKTTVTYLMQRNHQELPATAIAKASATHIPARMEIVHIGDKIVILDGAHNAQKIQAFAESVHAQFADEKIVALVGFVAQVDAARRMQEGMQELKKCTRDIMITQFGGPGDDPHHGVAVADVQHIAEELGFHVISSMPNPETAFTTLLQRPERVLLVVGSFYLLNHIRTHALKLAE